MRDEVTVGIDVGTSSVKAVAVDADGTVLARSRVPHSLRVPRPLRLEHDPDEAWRRGPRAALAALGASDARAVSVAAMIPSLAAVDAAGRACSAGLLYGDERAHTTIPFDPVFEIPGMGDLLGLLQWLAAEVPAAGYWPAQAVANHELAGAAALDTIAACAAYPLFDLSAWDGAMAARAGACVEQLPAALATGEACGRVDGDGPLLGSGCVDAFAEQLVAGADEDGDVLVLLGTTLVAWVVTAADVRLPGYSTVFHSAPGMLLVGGPSNAGGLFCDWVGRVLGPVTEPAEPDRVPVWLPYLRGERAPVHDASRRGVLADLDLTHGTGAVRRAAHEATGFVVRRLVDAARAEGIRARRVVATGGGTNAAAWVAALADATQLPVDCVEVPEGAALGSAWLARVAAGLEAADALGDARRWARTGTRVEPDPAWAAACDERYARFRELSP